MQRKSVSLLTMSQADTTSVKKSNSLECTLTMELYKGSSATRLAGYISKFEHSDYTQTAS